MEVTITWYNKIGIVNRLGGWLLTICILGHSYHMNLGLESVRGASIELKGWNYENLISTKINLF